jgi:hypothetical protein
MRREGAVYPRIESDIGSASREIAGAVAILIDEIAYGK